MKLSPSEKFYARVISCLEESSIPFLIGGSYAARNYFGPKRNLKDLDILCLPRDARKILNCAEKAGFEVEMTNPRWLGKIFNSTDYVDVIFSTSNGKIKLEEDWFERSKPLSLFGIKTRAISPEDMILTKMYVFGRDCFHGHDIYKLIKRYHSQINWRRLLKTVGKDHLVFSAHVALFDFVFPRETEKIPDWFRKKLATLKKPSRKNRAERAFRGKELSLIDYKAPSSSPIYNHPLRKKARSKR